MRTHQEQMYQAAQAFLEHDYHTCLALLQQAVPQALEPAQQKMLLDCYSELGEYDAVLAYVKEQDATLFEIEGVAMLYVHALCMTQRFLDAWFVSVALADLALQERVSTMESSYLMLHPEQVRLKERQLLELKQGKRQAKTWNEFLTTLTSQQAKAMLPQLLLYTQQTQVHLKSKAAELLVKLHETRTLPVTHPISQEEQLVSFVHLTTLEASPQLQALDQASRKLAAQPQVLYATVAEIRAHWAYLYPFLPEVATVKQWVDVYALDYTEQKNPLESTQTVEERKIQETKEIIRRNFSLFS